MKPLIIANWKMNPQSLTEAKELFELVKKGVKDVKKVEVVICPPFIYLPGLEKDSSLELGAQDCFWKESGPFTGAISVKMLKNLGCQFVIVGHSERRCHFRETDLTINKKIKAVLENGLRPILCVGEKEERGGKGGFSTVIKTQIEKGLKKIPSSQINDIVLAYEPVWAIGTGKACKPAQAKVINLFIRKIITKLYNRSIAEELPVLYGGSVNRENALGYLKESGMKGLLVGGASLKSEEFIGIVRDADNL